MNSQPEICQQFLRGKCRRSSDSCRFHHPPIDLPPRRPNQCSYIIGNAKRCESNASDNSKTTIMRDNKEDESWGDPSGVVMQQDPLCSLHSAFVLQEQRQNSRKPAMALTRVSGTMGRVLNPLSVRNIAPPLLPSQLSDPSLPLIVDIGSARGLWLLRMCTLDRQQQQEASHYNYIGFETRGVLVEAARSAAQARGLQGSLHYVEGDAASNLEGVLAPLLSDAQISHITIHFPDPWSKRKHIKRRIVAPAFIHTCAKLAKPGGCLHICSNRVDIVEAAYDTIVDECSAFWTPCGSARRSHEGDEATVENPQKGEKVEIVQEKNEVISAEDEVKRLWMQGRQFICGTERDEVAEKQHETVHRVMFLRNSNLSKHNQKISDSKINVDDKSLGEDS